VTPTALEADILRWLSRHCEHAAIAAQARVAVVTKRDYTGAGYFVGLSVPESAERLATGEDVAPIPGPYIESPELEHGADTVVFLANGVIETLEIFSYGESFPERLSEHTLKGIDRRRDRS